MAARTCSSSSMSFLIACTSSLAWLTALKTDQTPGESVVSAGLSSGIDCRMEEDCWLLLLSAAGTSVHVLAMEWETMAEDTAAVCRSDSSRHLPIYLARRICWGGRRSGEALFCSDDDDPLF